MLAIVGLAKNEADVAPYWVAHYLNEGAGLVLVADNLSDDGTGDLLRDAGAEVVLDSEPGYFQAAKTTDLAHRAAEKGATIVLPVDLDELWYGQDGRPLHDVLGASPATLWPAQVFDHIAKDEMSGNPFTAHGWRRREAQQFPVVGFRYDARCQVAMGNHAVYHPSPQSAAGLIAVRHFGYRSLAQMTRKLRQGKAAYDATDMPPSEGAHWREGGALSDQELAARWDALCAEEGLVFDPAPYRTEPA
jgi:hypothetical protein